MTQTPVSTSGASESHLLVSDGVETGRLDLVAVVMETHVAQHHDSAEQQGGGVRHVQAGDVGGGAVDLQEEQILFRLLNLLFF